ncbi:uncharacterized protein TNCV_4350381 [Trichonephila clavipes]|nr:uncharacterized protein TNCV_4350381 [Trichonephila clavipes]
MLGRRTDLHIFDAGLVNGTRYCNEILLPYVRLFRGAMGLQFLFMDDNAPCHRTVAAEQLLESEDIERMDWPARSPDLNTIEHVWDFLGRRLAARTLPPVTIRELRLALQDEWAAMPQQLIDTLILSMSRRCETCLAVRGRSYPLLKTVCFLLDTHHRDVSAFSRIALHATFSIKLLFIPLISLLVRDDEPLARGTIFWARHRSKRPKYDVVTLAMHEGVPGHHFQYAYAMEQEGIPDFKKYGVHSTAFVEGWALYAEYLGYELELFDNPYMRYGHLSYEIFRACRMVVDTGMHVMGWTRQQAIDYMMNNSASTLNNIEREVDRYITWPGQACAYKYGELKIKAMRKRVEEALGEAFDVKEFHDIVLRSNGPLELVEKKIDRYIASSKQ